MRERLGIIAIVIGVLVDIVLVTLAMQHVRPVESQSTADAAAPSASASGSPSASISGPPSASTTRTPTYLSVASDGSFIRASRGSCEEDVAPVVELSTDGGHAFEQVTVADGLSEVLRVQSKDATDMRLVGANVKCELGVYATSDAGANWTSTPGTVGLWHLVPEQSRAAIHAPGGVVGVPCPPTNLSTLDAGVVRALCRDGRILGTVDNGRSWRILGELEKAAAIRWTTTTQGHGLASQGGCRAAVLESVDGGASWNRLTCLGDGTPLALDAAGDIIAAQVGRTLHVSSDSGATWEVL